MNEHPGVPEDSTLANSALSYALDGDSAGAARVVAQLIHGGAVQAVRAAVCWAQAMARVCGMAGATAADGIIWMDERTGNLEAGGRVPASRQRAGRFVLAVAGRDETVFGSVLAELSNTVEYVEFLADVLTMVTSSIRLAHRGELPDGPVLIQRTATGTTVLWPRPGGLN